MRLAVVACDMIRNEIGRLVADDPDISEVVYLEAALHIYPERMRDAIVEQVNALAGQVDAVFLGYGYCQSLRGIEELCDVPVVLPPYDDCIQFLLGPEQYRDEMAEEVGTWFMSPGWAEVSAEMIIKELKLERAARYGRDPMEMARRLFTHYRRGVFFGAGMAEDDLPPYREQAKKFCDDFGIRFEERDLPESPVLRDELERAKRLARDCRELDAG